MMKGPKVLVERDSQINELIGNIVKIVRDKRIEKDKRGHKRGQWFANNQLDNIRQLLERGGYKTARVFQVGKIEREGNRWEITRNEGLLQILDLIGNSSLDVTICSYIIGKLNPILEGWENKGEKR